MGEDLTELYDALMAAVPSGVQIFTLVDDEGMPRGMTVSSLTPVSSDPPSVLVCIGGAASMRPAVTQGRSVCLSFLGPDQVDLSTGFAYAEERPFEVFAWAPGVDGVPEIEGAVAHLRGVIERVVDHHDTAVTLIGLRGGSVAGKDALVYWKKGYFWDLSPVAGSKGGSW
jgi:flavin reductase (NADH)